MDALTIDRRDHLEMLKFAEARIEALERARS